jgi:3-deoxy-D-manno-octulosonic-acid transferase
MYGPHVHSQPGFAALMQEYGAGMVVQAEELETKVAQLIEDRSLLHSYGKRGIALVEGSKGALEKTWNKIQEFLVIK